MTATEKGTAMTDLSSPSTAGAFVQLIEFQTEDPGVMEPILQRWLDAIGAHRTARWYVTAADRDHPGTFLQMVEFPDHAAAVANSDHPATAQFAADLRAACSGDPTFRNLDVVNSARL
jgi:quinol monooxygenase YgiN